MKQTKKITESLRTIALALVFLALAVLSVCAQTPVEKFGQLSIKGNQVVDATGAPVQLTGMSLFWSQWMGQYYNADCVKWLAEDWKCSVVRAAMGVGAGGYATNPDVELKKVTDVIDAAIANGIYVIVDFHEHKAESRVTEARTFFEAISKKYGNTPNVIYELYNEPLNVSWTEVIKPYCEDLISIIRKNDPHNIIVCGTRNWSQKVSEAADNPILQPNIGYVLHFYAGTHKKDLMDEMEYALNKGICIVVTEYGTTNANGDGPVWETETKAWWDLMDKYHISHCNWSVADKKEGSAALKPGSNGKGGWSEEEITPSGKFVKAMLLEKYTELMGK